MSTKKHNNIFLKILTFLFLIFTSLMIVLKSGYYETKKQNDVVLTNNKIKEFEEKLKNNEKINLEAYMKEEQKYYGNKISELGVDLTYKTEKIIATCFKGVDTLLKKLF